MGNPVGAPPWLYDPAIGDQICDMVADGKNLHVISKIDGLPGRNTIYKWLRESAEFANNYARAREDRADWRASRIDEITQEVREGKLEPNAARVIIDAEKWQAGKENSKIYGDKQTIDVNDQSPLAKVNYGLIIGLIEQVERERVRRAAGSVEAED